MKGCFNFKSLLKYYYPITLFSETIKNLLAHNTNPSKNKIKRYAINTTQLEYKDQQAIRGQKKKNPQPIEHYITPYRQSGHSITLAQALEQNLNTGSRLHHCMLETYSNSPAFSCFHLWGFVYCPHHPSLYHSLFLES